MSAPTRPRRRRGSAAIEFALTLPIWFVLIVGIVDFSWLFYSYSVLDAAANIGCRAGSLVDPGDRDEHIHRVEDAATNRMTAVVAGVLDADCESCVVQAFTMGAPPRRALVCYATRDVSPLIGWFYETITMTSTQVARLEWQREAAE